MPFKPKNNNNDNIIIIIAFCYSLTNPINICLHFFRKVTYSDRSRKRRSKEGRKEGRKEAPKIV